MRWRVPARVVKEAAALGLLSLALLVAATSCAPRPATNTEVGSGAGDTRVARERVVLHGVSLDASGEDGGSSSLSAKRLVVRHRTGGGGLLFYHDVRELLAEDARITVLSDAGGRTRLSRVLDGVKRLFASTASGDPSQPMAVRSGGAHGRVLFEGLAIRVVDPAGGELLLAANRGRLSFDPDMLVLDERVEMRTPLGQELRSPRVAFSADFEGIHLPAGYAIGGTVFAKGALVVGADGGLAAAADVAAPRLDDRLDRTERQVLAHLVERAPRELQPLILALLASLTPAGSREPEP